jgi:serine/threonine-protein kinase
LNPGDIIEKKYRIVRLLGEGGMGAVFEGENVRIKRRVAIKVLHSAIASDPAVARRFQQEAQAAGHIGNEHIIEVLDLGELPNGDHFMVMEYLDGEPLSGRIKRLGRLSPEQAVPLFKQILAGLGAAHDAGILHRDLKPDNIFILNEKGGQQDFVKIIDFGISKFQPLAGELKMTRTGTIMGTPYYMSPEQASGAREMNVQSDIYAIGVILYEALSGAVPFDAPTFNQLMFRIVLSEAAPIEGVVPDINPAFATIVKKAMAREQAHRFASCHEFRAALEAWSKQGVGVNVPPVAAADVYLPEDAAPSAVGSAVAHVAAHSAVAAPVPGQLGAGPSFSKTNQAWTNTGPDQRAAKKNKAPLFLGLAFASVLVVGGAGAVLLTGGSDEDDAATAAAQALTEVAAEATTPSRAIEDTAAEVTATETEKPPDGASNTAPEAPPATAASVAEATPSASASAAEASDPSPPAAGKKRPRPRAPTTKPPSQSDRRDFGY